MSQGEMQKNPEKKEVMRSDHTKLQKELVHHRSPSLYFSSDSAAFFQYTPSLEDSQGGKPSQSRLPQGNAGLEAPPGPLAQQNGAWNNIHYNCHLKATCRQEHSWLRRAEKKEQGGEELHLQGNKMVASGPWKPAGFLKQLSSLRKTEATTSYAFCITTLAGVLSFHLALDLALMNTFEDIVFHLGNFAIKRPP